MKSRVICRNDGITEQTCFRQGSRYGGLQGSEAKTLNHMPTPIVINWTTTNDDRIAERKYQ